ncbi:MAG: pyruvate kinase [Bryobacterales bacterium]|nr:pyruvate kinase [Bryobacterales bacterium]
MPTAKNPPVPHRLAQALSKIVTRALKLEKSMQADIEAIAPAHRASARNLLHYLSLRQHDVRDMQHVLASYGLSSLGRAEPHTLASLMAVLCALDRIMGEPARTHPALPVDFATGPALLSSNAGLLLGPAPQRPARIMVTMPSEAARDYTLVRGLVDAGMDVMRINCAHDETAAWQGMIANLRRAERETGRRCRILMDLAGPKLRTGSIARGSHLVRFRPSRSVRGEVTGNARIWITRASTPAPPPESAVALPVDDALFAKLETGDLLLAADTRGRRRSIGITVPAEGGFHAESDQSGILEQGTRIELRRDGAKAGEGLIGNLPYLEEPILLSVGDPLLITTPDQPGQPARRDHSGRIRKPAAIPSTLPEIFRQVRVGQRIFFDDGKIGAVVRRAGKQHLLVEITQAAPGGAKLRSDKGINLPDTDIRLPALTARDLEDLDFAAAHADMIGLSFVRRAQDVARAQRELAKRGASSCGIVLKIENRSAFEQLPKLLLQGLQTMPLGVMVARGDLGVELGFERLAEVQEEILWLCEAAHVPVIWATQVLEGLAKTGVPTRAEVTDAAMAGRAECVMLNKGPHIVGTVRFLNDVLERMQKHQHKKVSMLRRLSVSELGAAAGKG